MSIIKRARPEILSMPPYRSARSLIDGATAHIYLDANENAFEPAPGTKGYARYPDQQPQKLVDALCRLYDVSSRNMMIGRGADEAIDLLVRAFCTPYKDNILICPPSFAMYAHSAEIQGIAAKKAPLKKDFQLDMAKIKKSADKNTKIVFICSPNNPTANLMRQEDVEALCRHFEKTALVVVDETYIDFSGAKGFVGRIEEFGNLVVLRTLSKSHAMAGLRCGVAIARQDVVELLKKILPPYPLPVPVVDAAASLLTPHNLDRLAEKRAEILQTRDWFASELKKIKGIKVFPSDTNYLLVKVVNANALHKKCLDAGIVLRNQSHVPGLENCLRISIGPREDMGTLLSVLKGKKAKTTATKDRRAEVTRRTKETAITVRVNLDSPAPVRISTGLGFYDHMLEQIAKHAGFALELECAGDLEIDSHHTVEDCAIALGQGLKEALGEKRGIGRFGFVVPMDESLAEVAIDLSGRFYLDFQGQFPDRNVNDLPTDMVEHVFRSLCENMAANCHIKVSGKNTHHMVEACFKGFGRALRQAIRVEDGDLTPSTKGVL